MCIRDRDDSACDEMPRSRHRFDVGAHFAGEGLQAQEAVISVDVAAYAQVAVIRQVFLLDKDRAGITAHSAPSEVEAIIERQAAQRDREVRAEPCDLPTPSRVELADRETDLHATADGHLPLVQLGVGSRCREDEQKSGKEDPHDL